MEKMRISLGILIVIGLFACKKEMAPGFGPENLSIANAKTPGPTSAFSLQWQKCLGSTGNELGNAIAAASDGYYVAGKTVDGNGFTDVVISKIGLNGELLWQKFVAEAGMDEPSSIVVTPDGGCLAAGYTTSNSVKIVSKGGGDVLLLKYSSSGQEEWVKTMGGSGYDRAWGLIKISDYSYALSGETTSTDGDVTNSVINGAGRTWLVKFNILTGAPVIEWQNTYINIPESTGEVGYALAQAQDGSFLIAGRAVVSGQGAQIILINTDNSGVVKWMSQRGVSNADLAFSATASSDGYVITGYDGNDLIVEKYNFAGTAVWQKSFAAGSSGGMQGRSVISTAQGDIVTGFTNGRTGDLPGTKGGQDLFVLQLNDANGSKIASNVFGGTKIEIGRQVIRANDGSYVVVGNTSSTSGDVSGNHGSDDIWVLKISIL